MPESVSTRLLLRRTRFIRLQGLKEFWGSVWHGRYSLHLKTRMSMVVISVTVSLGPSRRFFSLSTMLCSQI